MCCFVTDWFYLIIGLWNEWFVSLVLVKICKVTGVKVYIKLKSLATYMTYIASVKIQAIVYIVQVVRWETRYIMVSQTIRVSQTSLVSNCSYLNILDHWISAIDKHKLVGTLFLDSTQSLWFSLPCHFTIKALSVL